MRTLCYTTDISFDIVANGKGEERSDERGREETIGGTTAAVGEEVDAETVGEIIQKATAAIMINFMIPIHTLR